MGNFNEDYFVMKVDGAENHPILVCGKTSMMPFVDIKMKHFTANFLIWIMLLGAVGICSAQNPITPEGEFFADPSARQWKDGRVYLYGSRDESVDYWCSYGNDVLSSDDMNSWTLHKNVFSSRGKNDEVAGTDALLFASDCMYKDSIYYLFYCTPDKNHSEGIATSHSPTGPFRGGYQLAHCTGIDPSVLIDDDGEIYYYWGQKSLKVAKLKPDFSDIELSTMKDGVLTVKEHYFHEGVQAFKRNGTYYLSFADESRRGMPTCIGYATSDSPTGPFVYRGVIIDNYGCDPGVWNNHGSVMEINGSWYVFYHRSTNGGKKFRKACIEPVKFDNEGLIEEVEMTSQGVGEALNPFIETEARRACSMTGNVRISTLADGQERLTGIQDDNSACWKYFNFSHQPKQIHLRVISKHGGTIRVYTDNREAEELCRIFITPGDGKTMTEQTAKLTEEITEGVHALHFRFSGEKGKDLFDIDSFLFK